MRITMKKYLTLFAALLLLNGIVPFQALADSHDTMTGTGTSADPYIIMTLDHLNTVRDHMSSHYKLGADIDASETASWNSGEGFIPIGGNESVSSQFTGVFDGQLHVISNLTINRPTTDLIGLFGIIGAGGVVRNVGLVDGYISGTIYVGGLVGHNIGTVDNSYVTGAVSAVSGIGNGIVGGLTGYNGIGSIVTDSYASATVSGPRYVGGLVGRNDSVVSNSYATGAVSGTIIVGGLIGDNEGGEVIQSYATGAVSGSDGNVGGLVGYNIGGGVSKSYASGAVSGQDAVGGLVGITDSGLISHSYATGTVTGTNYVGGLVGNNGVGTINQSYATSTVIGTNDVGGLIGLNSGEMTSTLWDMETSGRSNACGSNTGPGTCLATGLTTEQAVIQASYPGWDFTDIWIIEQTGYPTLRAIDVTPPTISISMKTADDNEYVNHTWTDQNVTVTASAYDAKSDLASYTYSIDSGATWSSYTSDIVLQDEGVYSLTFKAIDTAGNTFSSMVGVNIDKSAPSVSFAMNGNESWVSSAQTIVTVTDIISGLDASTLRYVWTTDTAIPAAGWTSFASGDVLMKSDVNGDWYLHIQAVDTVGNMANIGSSRFRMDASTAALSGLTVSEGTLNPSFLTNITSYSISVGNSVYGLSITPLTEYATDIMMVNINDGVAQQVLSGEQSEQLALNVGNNTITLHVAALNGLQQTYTITANRALAESTPSRSEAGDILPDNTKFVSVDGGTSTFSVGQIFIPSGALNQSIQLTINEVVNTKVLPLSISKEQLISKVIELTKDQAGKFNQEVIISLQFTADLLQQQDVKVSLYWLNEETNEWVELENTVVDWDKGIVSGTTDHFTKFAVLATPVESEEQPQEKDETDVHFTDIHGHWAEVTIQLLAGKGVVVGYPDGTFKPDHAITRAEFAAILVRAMGLPLVEGNVFTDTADHWASNAISSAYAYGYIHGYNQNTYAPDELITREQMAMMIVNALQLEDVQVGQTFADQGMISTWAQQSVAAAVEHSMIAGYPDNTMKPKAHATRAEALTVILSAQLFNSEEQ